MRAYGRLDIAFNNAGADTTSGVSKSTAVTELEEADWDRIIDVNLKGVWLSMKHELRAMPEAGAGSIISTSSIAGLVGVRNSAAYTASKHGVVGLTKAAALEVAGSDRGAKRGRRRRLPLLGRRVLPHGRGDPGGRRLGRRLAPGAGRGGVRRARIARRIDKGYWAVEHHGLPCSDQDGRPTDYNNSTTCLRRILSSHVFVRSSAFAPATVK